MIEHITEILEKLTPEDLEKLKLLSGIFSQGISQFGVTRVTNEQGLREYEKNVEYRLSPKSISLIKTANRRFLQFFPGNKYLHTIKKREAENLFIANIKSAPSGAYNYHRVYRAMFNCFKNWRYVDSNPFEFRLPPRQKEEPVVISFEHINIINNKLIEKGQIVLADMVLFAVETGLRLGEETNLRISDVDFENKIITIGNRLFKTKSKRVRKIPMNDRMEEILNRNIGHNLSSGRILSEFVFIQRSGKPYQLDSVSKAFKKVCRENGLPKQYHWHCLRSTAATRWASKKVPIFTVSKLLGHSSVNLTTRFYANVELDELRDAVNKI